MGAIAGAGEQAPGSGSAFPTYVFERKPLGYAEFLELKDNVACRVLSRKTAADSTIGKWNSNLTSPDPWFKDVVPDVSGRSVPFVVQFV